MARTGRPRKAAEAKVGHYEPRAVAVTRAEPPVIVPEAPRMPIGGGAVEELLPDALLLWSRFWTSELPQALDGVRGVDRAVVEKWIVAENRLLVIERTLGTDFTTTGSTGQQVLHPLWRARLDTLAEIRTYWEVLGLNPRDRARLGIDLLRQNHEAADWNERLAQMARG